VNEDLLELDMLGMTVDYQEASDVLEDFVHDELYVSDYDGIDWGDNSDII